MLELLGGLGLFLLGMTLMTGGLRRLAGRALNRSLHRFTRNAASGALTGAIATAILQSSSATTVATVGLVAGGMLSFAESLGILFGANIGTTITGWLVALLGIRLDLGRMLLPVLLVGVLLRLFAQGRWKAIGRSLAGFSVLFLGIDMMQAGMAPYEGLVTPEDFPADTWPGRLGLLGIGALVTLVTQSSSAGVAAALTALDAGATTFQQAAAMVIGMDVGTTSTTAISAVGRSAEVRRTAFSHVIYNLFTGLGALFLLDPYVLAFEAASGVPVTTNATLALVGFHTTFNTIGVVVVLPFTKAFARLMLRLVPPERHSLTASLDEALVDDATAALQVLRRAHAGLVRGTAAHAVALLEGRVPDVSAEELVSAVRETRRYADRVHAVGAHAEARSELLAELQGLDHLERLLDRLEQGRRIRVVCADPDLAGWARRLREGLEELARTGDEASRPSAELVGALRALHGECAGVEHAYRQRTLERAAEDELPLDEALERLDAVRWLVRSAYHVERIAHYLALPPGDA